MSDVKIKATAIQNDPDGNELSINISCDGEIGTRNGRIYIKYEEDVSGEGDIVENTISFDPGERGIISLSRVGGIDMDCVFEEGKRYPCLYGFGIGALDLFISSRNVENNMDIDGGEIYLEYTAEARGVIIQEIKYRLTVEKA